MGSHSDDFEARMRFIRLDGGQRRDAMDDCRTAAPSVPSLPRHSPFEALFIAHYRAIRALGRDADPGIALVVVHVPSCALRARAWFAARPDGLTTALVGRHSEADVLLEAPTISLRHLALLVAPGSGGGVRYEVLDLRTQQPFFDERGRPLEAVQAEGPALFSCGPYAFYLLPTGDPAAWPELATEAWARLPERVLLEEREAEPERWRRRGHVARREVLATESVIRSVAPLLTTGDSLLTQGERPLGTLRVHSEHGLVRLPLGAQAAIRGVLLGRYSRCDASVILGAQEISRTHLLVKCVAGQLVGVDTASTAGRLRRRAGEPHRGVRSGRGSGARRRPRPRELASGVAARRRVAQLRTCQSSAFLGTAPRSTTKC